MNDSIACERKSIERLIFEQYMRTGQRPALEKFGDSEELKFNPHHDPDDGRFTFAPGGSRLAPKARNPASSSSFPSGPRPTRPQRQGVQEPFAKRRVENVGALSAKYESRLGGDPGAVSIPKGDRGGVSYGSHQLATNTGTVGEFIASPEARPWAKAFNRLMPGTPQFSAKWKEVADRSPKSFSDAQDAYVARSHYDVAARKIKNATGLDLDMASDALRQVTYSTAVQHGASGGPQVIAEAIRKTDSRMKRTDPRHQPALINAIYDRRTEIFRASEARYRRIGLGSGLIRATR